jgi:hypothetical protein
MRVTKKKIKYDFKSIKLELHEAKVEAPIFVFDLFSHSIKIFMMRIVNTQISWIMFMV